jgi:hypothetical protein
MRIGLGDYLYKDIYRHVEEVVNVIWDWIEKMSFQYINGWWFLNYDLSIGHISTSSCSFFINKLWEQDIILREQKSPKIKIKSTKINTQFYILWCNRTIYFGIKEAAWTCIEIVWRSNLSQLIILFPQHIILFPQYIILFPIQDSHQRGT